jgi:cytochrome c oxidase subunit 4
MNTSEYNFPIRPCTLVYVVLMALTVTTWLIGKDGYSGLGVALLVLAFALIKGLLIGDYYMGLKGVRGLWRWAIIIWLIVPGGLITWAFISAA